MADLTVDNQILREAASPVGTGRSNGEFHTRRAVSTSTAPERS